MLFGDFSQQLWAFLSHPRTFFSSAGPLGLPFEMGRGTQVLWPHNLISWFFFFFNLYLFFRKNKKKYTHKERSSNIKAHHKFHFKLMTTFKGVKKKLYYTQHILLSMKQSRVIPYLKKYRYFLLEFMMYFYVFLLYVFVFFFFKKILVILIRGITDDIFYQIKFIN